MKKVKLGVIGLGNIGYEHAFNVKYRVRGAELAAVCARTREKTDRMKEELEVESAYNDYRALLKHPGLDGVVIVSPSACHCEHIVAALDAGLHVFTEKPIALNLREVSRIEEAAARQPEKKVLQLGFMRRFDPSYLDAKEKIEQGLIGEPFLVKSHSSDPLWTRDFMVRYSPTSGGLFFDMTQHCFDMTRWILGAEAKRVFATGGAYVIDEFKELHDMDNAAALVEYDGGKMGMYHSGRTAVGGYRVETEIVGTEGVLRVGMVAEKNLLTIHDKHGSRRECIRWYQERFKEANINELQAFVDCVRENRPASVGVIDGRRAIELCEACNRSVELKQAVEL